MALSDLYFVTSDLDTYFVDPSSGLPLAGGQIYFYRDIARTELKPIFTLNGSPPYSPSSYVPLPNPLTLSQVGTVQDASGDNVVIYYYPWITDPISGLLVLDLYYVVVTDSAGTVVLTREAWPPNIISEEGPQVEDENFTSNQLSNPQFTNVFINPGIPTIYTVTGATLQVFEFAPDWFFQISGTGTVTVQIIPISGSQNVPTSPPYVLDIDVSTGISDCRLVQRFPNNSGLWTTTSADAPVYLYGSFVAQNELAGTGGINMFYAESTPSYVPVLIVPGSFTNPYVEVFGNTTDPIPASTNPQTGETAYVDIYLSFAFPSHVQVSSIQMIPSEVAPVNFILPDYDSSNRNEVYQGDYYIPRAAAKQINSFLVGWDFPVNPYQFGVSGTITTTATYIADQTIACAATSNVTWIQDPVTNGLQFTGTGTNDAFYILQYLDGGQVKDMIGNRLSVNVFGYQNVPPVPLGDMTMRVYLFSAPALAPPPFPTTIPILPETIGLVAPTGVFTLTADAIANGWIAIPRSGLPIPEITVSQVTVTADISNGLNDYGFSGWQIADPFPDPTPTQYFAVVVTFAYAAMPSVLTVNSVSVIPGDLPCRPEIKTFDETLRECQYYYEKSYDVAIVVPPIPAAGPATTRGAIYSDLQFGFTAQISSFGFPFRYISHYIQSYFKVTKRLSFVLPFPTNLQIYSTTGAAGNINLVGVGDVPISGNWTPQPCESGFVLIPTFATVATTPVTVDVGSVTIIDVTFAFQFVSECRLGII